MPPEMQCVALLRSEHNYLTLLHTWHRLRYNSNLTVLRTARRRAKAGAFRGQQLRSDQHGPDLQRLQIRLYNKQLIVEFQNLLSLRLGLMPHLDGKSAKLPACRRLCPC
jgi:hypothetical protein